MRARLLSIAFCTSQWLNRQSSATFGNTVFVGSDATPLAAEIVLQKLEDVADVDDGNAGGVLAELYSPEGRSLHAEVVAAKLQDLLATRQLLVAELAKPNAWFGTWTQQEWLVWYDTHELPEKNTRGL